MPKSEYTAKFKHAETELKRAGWEPVNPCTFEIPEHSTSAKALEVCIPELEKCKAIYMLDDWRDSLVAIVEHNIAKHLNIDHYYQEYQPFNVMEKIKSEIS